MGFNYAKGLQRVAADALVEARTQAGEFRSVDDLALRVPALNRKDLVTLAQIGALNSIGEVEHRRDALWQAEEAARTIGPLLRSAASERSEARGKTPLRKMSDEERLAADFSGTGLTTGPHLMAYHRVALRRDGILSAAELEHCANHRPVSIAGCVIARQRPGTAKGFVFLSVEDETGIANVIIQPDVFEANRLVVTRSRILCIDGVLQFQDGVIHVKAREIIPLDISRAEVRSHDFY
jgi:error-prone DNA polymerase